MQKYFILDTNILIQNPNSIFGFADNKVVILSTVMQELDGLKKVLGETGFNAREAIRKLNEIQESHECIDSSRQEYRINEDGMVLFLVDVSEKSSELPHSFSLDKPDNRIINAALLLQKEKKNVPVVLVTNDISMRCNARMCKVEVQGYLNDEVRDDAFYTGRDMVEVAENVLTDFYAKGAISIPAEMKENLLYNEYVTLCCGSATALGYVNLPLNQIINIGNDNICAMGIAPKNTGQRFALHALLAPAEEIPLVIITGAAGTGKTMLSLAAALECSLSASKSMDDYYKGKNKILITRNNVLSDEPLGFLPGELDEKMGPLVSPFIDNLENILQKKGDLSRDDVRIQVEDMFTSGTIEICSLAYMRGRSISNSYLIVDEVQNATPSQVFEIVSRAGTGTKIILLGDPDQIDNPKLDKKNNGLVVTAEKMKNSPLCAQIAFKETESVRSPLAMESIMRLSRK